ncbi:MAG: DUF5615 family PIN-like protein [Dehalococcoidia bacterium]|nr:DUF5615 family PIN-like protein [Dehalococcoidia bacterium]
MDLTAFFDENCSDSVIIERLAALGFRCLSVLGERRLELPDEEQLAWAASIGAVVVTSDSDFLRLHSDWAKADRPHAGILFVRQRQRGATPRTAAFEAAFKHLATVDRTNGLWFLSNWE